MGYGRVVSHWPRVDERRRERRAAGDVAGLSSYRPGLEIETHCDKETIIFVHNRQK